MSTVAFRRVDSGTSQEEPAAEHKSFPSWLRSQGGGVVVHDCTEDCMFVLVAAQT